MKKILFVFTIGILLASCANTEVEKRIQNSISQNYNSPPKIKTFTNVENLIENLSKKSSLSFNNWTKSKFSDSSEKWSSNTAIEQFGKNSINGFQNDISYVIYGKEKKYCNEVQIILNIKNPKEMKKSLSTLSSWTEQTLNKLNLKIPDNLNESILDGKQFAYESDSAFILLQKENISEKNYNLHLEKQLEEEINYKRWKMILKSK
jgi:hypothetical protein